MADGYLGLPAVARIGAIGGMVGGWAGLIAVCGRLAERTRGGVESEERPDPAEAIIGRFTRGEISLEECRAWIVAVNEEHRRADVGAGDVRDGLRTDVVAGAAAVQRFDQDDGSRGNRGRM